MKEISDIIGAYTAALREGKRMALATVVHVEGSSYRRAGARMLITDDGKLTGAISGGCLEGEALRKALLVINQQQNKLVTYDTTDDEDAQFGVQLGCNGIVHILFEPIDPAQERNPIQMLEILSAQRQEGVLITLFSLARPLESVPGTCMLILKDSVVSSFINNQCVHKESVYNENCTLLLKEASSALLNRQSFTKDYGVDDVQLTAFVEFIHPPVALVIVGAGNDALPMAAMADILGWEITVVDGRASHATSARFPQAGKVIVSKADGVISQLSIDEQTVFVLMTHNYNYDIALLGYLIKQKNCQYIGSLGPRKKLERMINDLEEKGDILTANQQNKIFGPVGLDLGAETAEEIALSVIAEIKKVLAAKTGLPLREKQSPIHDFTHGARS